MFPKIACDGLCVFERARVLTKMVDIDEYS